MLKKSIFCKQSDFIANAILSKKKTKSIMSTSLQVY